MIPETSVIVITGSNSVWVIDICPRFKDFKKAYDSVKREVL
jgi:hypothetical protein